MRCVWVFIFVIWFELLVIFAPPVDVYNHSFMSGQNAPDVPFYLKMLGEGQSILSAMSVLQADRYFHRGMGHKDDHHDHEEEYMEGLKDHHASRMTDPFMRISEEIGITEHVHLEGEQVKEIIPWLYYAVKIDPQNVQAYVLASYWAIDRLGKTQEGIDFLREGIKNNPDSWELCAELGRVYFKDTENYAAAARVLARASRLLANVPHDKFQEREVLSLLAYSYKELGQDEKAHSAFLRISELFPDDRSIRERITQLSPQDDPA